MAPNTSAQAPLCPSDAVHLSYAVQRITSLKIAVFVTQVRQLQPVHNSQCARSQLCVMQKVFGREFTERAISGVGRVCRRHRRRLAEWPVHCFPGHVQRREGRWGAQWNDPYITARSYQCIRCCAANYEFKIARLPTKPGTKYKTTDLYADLMVKVCKQYSMKPVCDNPTYCNTDRNSIFIGQSYHLSYPPHRTDVKKGPPGFAAIEAKWKGLCSYSGKQQKGVNVLCNIPVNTHSWQSPASANPGFICARVLGNPITCNPEGGELIKF